MSASYTLEVIEAAALVDNEFSLYGMSKCAAHLDLLRSKRLLKRRVCNREDRELNVELAQGDFIYEWTPEGEALLNAFGKAAAE